MIIPLPGDNLEEWARQLTQVLQLDLERELEAVKVPAGALVIFSGNVPPEGWAVHEDEELPELPTGMVYITRG